MYIQNAQGQQVMAPQGSYQQGNYLYNQNGQIIAQLNGIRQAGIATAVGTWLEVGLTGLFGGLMMRNNRGGSNVSSLHYVGGPGTGGAVNWPNGLTSGGNTSTLSGGPVNWNNGVYGH